MSITPVPLLGSHKRKRGKYVTEIREKVHLFHFVKSFAPSQELQIFNIFFYEVKNFFKVSKLQSPQILEFCHNSKSLKILNIRTRHVYCQLSHLFLLLCFTGDFTFYSFFIITDNVISDLSGNRLLISQTLSKGKHLSLIAFTLFNN